MWTIVNDVLVKSLSALGKRLCLSSSEMMGHGAGLVHLLLGLPRRRLEFLFEPPEYVIQCGVLAGVCGSVWAPVGVPWSSQQGAQLVG
ncbi:hypothetical protein NHX12_019314 [Muraenolepis orangiensis]|uniref:Uncharacterized protein n=1 Tax=Muraenolepis orangiensis TaxID=630683 RepID=A0A9Q0EV44_9TELE|nr:hypothetical protein NHX12_019314 [Muraenolepis orangiensis]